MCIYIYIIKSHTVGNATSFSLKDSKIYCFVFDVISINIKI